MTIARDVPLSEWCTLAVGGPARWFCRAQSERAVLDALAWAEANRAAVHVLGGGSNVVFADAGFDGLVLQVDIRGVTATDANGTRSFSAGAGEPWDPFVAATIDADSAGLECLSGIPGLVGGTPVQNVGAYGQDVSATITRVSVVDRERGGVRAFSSEECAFGYRTSRFKRGDQDRFIVTRVDFALAAGGRPTLAYADVIAYFEQAGVSAPSLSEVRDAVIRIRRRKGMVIEEGNPANHSVGSFFVNPVISGEHFARTLHAANGDVPSYPLQDGSVKVPAAWLIERAGFVKGTRRGAVGVSPFQAQAIVNHGGAAAADVVALATDIKRAVWEMFQIAIVPEPVFVGFAAAKNSHGLEFLLDPRPA
jgi:UDP-N-acetylmuramate dehydrogenase